jgi:hypothetical protein
MSVGLNHDRVSVLNVTNPYGYVDAATDWFKKILAGLVGVKLKSVASFRM